MKKLLSLILLGASVGLAGCATQIAEPKDYARFHEALVRSVLVVPVINHTSEVNASELFLTTMAVPLAERGFYVFPTNASSSLMNAEGLSDPGFVHQASTPELAALFGADAVLYVEVLEWKSSYAVISSSIDTEFLYTLKSGRDGQVIWQDQQKFQYVKNPQSGNIFADLIAAAVTAALDNSRSDYTPLALQANMTVLSASGQGLPYGPRSAAAAENAKLFPATGSGKISNAQREAMSAPGVRAPETK